MEGCAGEESFQLWELNRRLEAYLGRVQALEAQNEALGAELAGLRARAGDGAAWRARADGELAALRARAEQRWREKHEAELQRDGLAAELERVAGGCERLRRARARAAEEAARSRREAEAEASARDRLESRAAALGRELEALRAAHEEERAGLHARAARAPPRPAPPRAAPAPAPDVDGLARRLGDAWRGAVLGYQERVARMEASLARARERLAGAVRGAREGRLEVQRLGAERDGLRERRAAVEERLEGCWQERLRATEKFQLAVESLEQEKQDLQSQIAQVLEGRQQLAHLKMSLSLEVATYRTLLEAENSRLQTPGGGCSQASLGFQDTKLQPHFPGTPEGRRLGPVLPVLSPTPLPSPLPNTLETPVPAFLKSQEFLQAQPPTLASTPLSPTPQAPRLATHAEVRAQGASLFPLQTQGGGRQSPVEPPLAEAQVAVSDSALPELKEPGGKQPEASTGQFPENQASLASPLNAEHPTLEATDGIPGGPRVSSTVQEESEGQILGPVENEATIEIKVASSLGQEIRQKGRLDMEEVQASRGPLGKDISKALGEESQESPMSLDIQTQETIGNHPSPRPLENENLEVLNSLEEEKQMPMKSSEGKDMEEGERPLGKETPELPMPTGKDDPRTFPFLEEEDEELLLSPETVLFLGKENLVRSTEESPGALEKESQRQLRSLEAEGEETWRSPPEENQELLTTLEDENQETLRPPERENQEPRMSLEEDQRIERPPERENQESRRSPEEEGEMTESLLEKEDREPPRFLQEEETLETLRSLKEDDQRTESPLEKEDREPPRFLQEDEMTESPLEKEDREPPRFLQEDEMTESPLEKEDREPPRLLQEEETLETLRSLKEDDQRTERPLEKEDQESLSSPEDEMSEKEDLESLRFLKAEDQKIERSLEKEDRESLQSLEGEINLESLKSLKAEDQTIERPLEKEDQESPESPEEENEMIEGLLEKDNLESLSCVKEEDQRIERPLEKESQGTLASLEEDQKLGKPLENEHQESLRSLDEEDQELRRSPDQETQQPLTAVRDGGWLTLRPPPEVSAEPLKSLGKDQEMIQLLGKETREQSVETARSLETEDPEPPTTGGEKDVEPLWSREAMSTGAVKPQGGEIQEPPGSEAGDHEMLAPPGNETQELRSLDKSPERPEKESGQGVEVGERRESQESLGSLEEEGQALSQDANQPRWEDQAAGENPPLGRAGTEGEDLAELDHRGSRRGGKEEAAAQGGRGPDAPEEACSLGNTESREQRLLAEEASGIGGAEGLRDPEGQPKQVETPGLQTAQGLPGVVEPPLEDEDATQGGDQVSLEVTLRPEVATDQSVLGAGLRLDQEVVEQRDPGPPGREEVRQHPPGEENLPAEIAKGLDGPGTDPEETGAPEAGLSDRPRASSDPPELPEGGEEPEPEAVWGGEELLSGETPGHESRDAPQPRSPGSERKEDAHPVLTPTDPRPIEPCSATPVLEDVSEPQPQAEGSQEAGWGLEGRDEALGRVESEQTFSPVEISEGIQEEEEEESREESEADDLGETLPDSTPLGLYLRSPVSPKGDLAGDQRSPTQGEVEKEGWDSAVQASRDLRTPPSEEEEEEEEEKEEEEDGEAEIDPASGHVEEFEDLENESFVLAEVPREVAQPLGQLPPQVAPAGWDRDGESDGFADEEESGEEAEEEDEEAEPRGQWWGPGASEGSVQALNSSQRGHFLEPEAVDVSGPWNDGFKDTVAHASVTARETKAQDSAGPSGSEDESDSESLDREDQVLGPLDTPRGAEGTGTGDTWGLIGQGPNLEELEYVNGSVVNGLVQSSGVGQGMTQGNPGEDPDQGLPSQEEEGAALKTPWVGSPVHLGQGQFLKFTPRAADGDSWSSGED